MKTRFQKVCKKEQALVKERKRLSKRFRALKDKVDAFETVRRDLRRVEIRMDYLNHTIDALFWVRVFATEEKKREAK